MAKKIESIDDFQIINADDIDYLSLLKILQKKEFDEKFSINKKYVHSLFTPLLSFIINYLNRNNKINNLIIGRSNILDIPVVYSILNKDIYDLFFKREKGKPFNSDEEINYDTKQEEENYYISSVKPNVQKDGDSIKNILKEAINEDIEILLENQTLEAKFELKKKEIISMFRLGYSIQERIINLLKSNSENEITELPNIIFYKNNKNNKLFSEVDRIITVEKETKIKDFLVYLKAEIEPEKKEKLSIEEIPEGKILVLEKESCNFIEVKTSIYHLFDNDNNKKKLNNDNNANINNEINIQNPSELTSLHSNQKKKIKMFNNMKAFKNLFENLEKHFKYINLIIIIDSYFPKNFINLSRDFALEFVNEDLYFEFKIYFVHIGTNIEYTHQITEFEKINNNLKEKDSQILKLRDDANLKNIEINNIKKDAKEKDIKINNLNDEIFKLKSKNSVLNNKICQINENFNKLEMKLKKHKLKKKIQKELKDFIQNEIEKNKKIFSKDECHIIAKEKIFDVNYSEKLEKNKIKSENIFDFKTFCLCYFNNDNKNLIKEIQIKHATNMEIISKIKNIKFLEILADFVFLLSLRIIVGKFSNYNIIIEPVFDKYFLIKFKKENDKSKITYLFTADLLGISQKNIINFIDYNNFINYYFEYLSIKVLDSIEKYPLYNPETDGCDYYLTIINTNGPQKNILVYIVDPIYEYEDYKFESDKNYLYIFIIHKTYYFNFEKNIIKNIIYFFDLSNNLTYLDIHIVDNEKVIYDDENKCVKLYKEKNKAFILDKNTGKVQYKYKVKNNDIFDETIIIDNNIINIMEAVSKLKKNNEVSILLEEPFNIIYSYIKNKYKNSKIVLLNDLKNEKINNFLNTTVDNKTISNINSYINTLKDKRFDLIILENNDFPNNNNNDVIPKISFFEEKKLKNIRNHLNEGGKFIFRLLLKNKYLKEKVLNKLKIIFNKVDLLYDIELDNIVICSEN